RLTFDSERRLQSNLLTLLLDGSNTMVCSSCQVGPSSMVYYQSYNNDRILFVAEEEGFYFPESKGGARWYALVCYSQEAGTKGVTVSPLKHSGFSMSNCPLFCSKCSTPLFDLPGSPSTAIDGLRTV